MLSFGVQYFIIEGFSNKKHCRQLKASEIALNVNVGLEEEAEDETAKALGYTIILFNKGEVLKSIPW